MSTYIEMTSLSSSDTEFSVLAYSHTTRSRQLLVTSVYPEQERYIERTCKI